MDKSRLISCRHGQKRRAVPFPKQFSEIRSYQKQNRPETTCGKSGKREPWKLTVHELMMEEFDRLRAARVKVTRNVISEIAIDFVLAGTITGLPNLPVLHNVTKCFIHDFCMRRSLV